MQRDWKTVKFLLEKFEQDEIDEYLDSVGAAPKSDALLSLEEQSARKEQARQQNLYIFGHLLLLIDAGLVQGVTVASGAKEFHFSTLCPRLTMKGHDTLDAIRSDTVWDAVKRRAKESAMPVTLELILAVLKNLSLLA